MVGETPCFRRQGQSTIVMTRRESGLMLTGGWTIGRRIGARMAAAALALLLVGGLLGSPAAAGGLGSVSERDLERGFLATVFGLEHGGSAAAHRLKKFQRPIRFTVDDHAGGREKAVVGFIRKLPSLVRGLDAGMARSPAEANFRVVVVTAGTYVARVRADAFGGHKARVSGNCMVKVDFDRNGIRQATAFIRGDDEALFRRCLVEEILQGLGPMNDDRSLSQSMFNDASPHNRPMPLDLAIVAALYDERLRHGMSRREAAAVLPTVLADVRRRQR